MVKCEGVDWSQTRSTKPLRVCRFNFTHLRGRRGGRHTLLEVFPQIQIREPVCYLKVWAVHMIPGVSSGRAVTCTIRAA